MKPLLILCFSLLLLIPLQAGTGCPEFHKAQKKGLIESPLIDEVSGIAASGRNPSVLWVHNDSGDSARVFAINIQGDYLGDYSLDGIIAKDFEDIAIGPGPADGVDYLYCGDIGDNKANRAWITVYRVAEPAVDPNQSPVKVSVTGIDTIRLQYPDGARDAETLMVDPSSRDIYVISKWDFPSRIYRAGYPQSTTEINTLEFVGVLPWGLAVGGDISSAGDWVIVRSYFYATIWKVENDYPLQQAFKGTACPVTLCFEPQGEAICFASHGDGFFTLSEGPHQPLYFYARKSIP